MELALPSLVSTPPGLRRSRKRKDVSCTDRCPLKVDRGFLYSLLDISAAVLAELRPLFAQFSLPETVVTDNGTCFVSAEFEEFLASHFGARIQWLGRNSCPDSQEGAQKTTDGSVRARRHPPDNYCTVPIGDAVRKETSFEIRRPQATHSRQS